MAKLPRYVIALLKINNDDGSYTLENLTEADIEEVVRCEGCAHAWEPFSTQKGVFCYCDLEKKFRKHNFYCADGERKQNA